MAASRTCSVDWSAGLYVSFMAAANPLVFHSLAALIQNLVTAALLSPRMSYYTCQCGQIRGRMSPFSFVRNGVVPSVEVSQHIKNNRRVTVIEFDELR